MGGSAEASSARQCDPAQVAQLLEGVIPAMLKAQQRLLVLLPAVRRSQFVAMHKTVVEANNGLGRAPSDG